MILIKEEIADYSKRCS